jgi:dihydroorotase
MAILIQNGRVLNPATGTDEVCDLYIKDGRIAENDAVDMQSDVRVINASGCFVMPGFIDLHVHLREPGLEYKETIATGTMAAAAGGFTTVTAMPNTKPVTDCPEMVERVKEIIKKDAKVRVVIVGAITKGQAGNEIADIEGMINAGIGAISEDGKSVMNSEIYKEAMEIAAKRNIPVLAHCEDINLVNGGVMNADEQAVRLGMKGISNAVEDIIVARDILLAKQTGAKLHLCHCSTKDSVRMVKEAKEDGIDVTAEVCPHHFTLTSSDIKSDNANYKMNPPLRTREDVDALIEGLKSGVMDAIATDHAPHGAEEKARSIESAPFGIVGLETAASLAYTQLVRRGYLTPMQMAERMSYRPAQILGTDRGDLSVGKPADVVIFRPNARQRVDASKFYSLGKNTPFDGWQLEGKVEQTICDGEIVYSAV